MKRKVLWGISVISFLFISYIIYCNWNLFYRLQSDASCSTFLINQNDSIIVGHNLDEYIDVPGAIFVNKRDVLKENISWRDVLCFLCTKKTSVPRIQWVSKYGSITYSYWGKDFIDGGMNEQGLYIGEMTLFGTKWIESEKPPFHHHLFLQYVLDNFATVEEALDGISRIEIDGHCQWHFFISDKSGKTAVIEFLNDSVKIHTDHRMPIQVLCNRTYEKELKLIPDNDSTYYHMLENDYVKKDLRFMLASKMINEYDKNTEKPIVDYAFSILGKMDMGNNKWSIVYDVKNLKMFFRTNKGKNIKSIDFSSFDFSCAEPVKVFDINTDLSGEVAEKFIDYSEELNKQLIRNGFDNINMGFIGNLILKPVYKKKLNFYTNSFKCEIVKD